jgi:pimeloyl-ACP methyl ester carboxylesterase
MADPYVEAAIANWLPRCLQAGMSFNDFQATTGRCESWDEWLPEWNRTADDAAAAAEQAEAEGHTVTAGEAWLRAAVIRHFGKLVWLVDPELHALATRQAADELRRAHERLGTGAEAIEVRAGEVCVLGILRRPAVAEPPPLVLLVPGLDSSKEEFFLLEEAFLRRGMATLSIDGPGQGEASLESALRPDYEVAVGAVLDALTARRDLDQRRVGVMATTVGGIFAGRAAAFDERLRAIVMLSTPFSMGALWDSLSPLIKGVFALKARVDDEASARELAATLDLTGICERIAVPALFVAGDQDPGVPWEMSERMAREAPHGRLHLVKGGNHGCSNMAHVVRPALADWMHGRLNEL